MRKKILFQVAVMIAGFMIALLVILEAAISHSSTRLFTEAKQELPARDLEACTTDMFLNGYSPEIMDYCKTHMDDASKGVLSDPDFKEEYKRVFPGLLERYGVAKYDGLRLEDFPDFHPDEQAVYARLWYDFLADYLSMFQEYYGFSSLAIIDLSGSRPGSAFAIGTTEDGVDRETLERILSDENERNGTLGKINGGEKQEAEFGIAYCGKGGDWLAGYYPLLPMTETCRYAACILIDLKQFNNSLSAQLSKILLFGFAVIAVFGALLIWFLNRKTIRPVKQIQKSVRRYTDDKDTGKIVDEMKKVRVENEFGMLAGDISHLAEEMERYTRENISLVAEHERINTEMNLARDIQASALPSGFPAFPERGEFDLHASMTPAREVGGDFYDFFLVDSDHLVFLIADVSGKGIPAALFMMTVKTMIKNRMQTGCEPAEALDYVNRQLSERNASMMFVTVWLAVLEISTGKGLSCNAGHEHPALRHADGKFSLLVYPHNMLVGGLKKARYKNREFELQPGDCIFVYTDGVTEAKNTAGEMFGEKRLAETLNQRPDAEPEELIRHVHDAVDRFAGDAEQFDDITMLCLKYNG